MFSPVSGCWFCVSGPLTLVLDPVKKGQIQVFFFLTFFNTARFNVNFSGNNAWILMERKPGMLRWMVSMTEYNLVVLNQD